MKLFNLVEKLLSSNAKPYEFIQVDKSLSIEQLQNKIGDNDRILLRSVLLRQSNQLILSILPADEIIEFDQLQEHIGHSAKIVSLNESKELFLDKNLSGIPPVQAPQISQVYLSKSILRKKTVIFETGQAGVLAKTNLDKFISLHNNLKIESFSTKSESLSIENEKANSQSDLSTKYTPDVDKKSQLEKLYKLPPMPQIAQEIITLRSNKNANVTDLAEVIQKDPSLTAQVIRHSKSAFYRYQGEINSVGEAISRVLGFDLVLNMTLGLSTGQSLKNPSNGPLGSIEFWKHATFSATLAQRLARKIPAEQRPNPNLAYLSGLLHNFGFLLLGHLFQPEFFLLNKLYAANLTCPISSIEKHALGMGAGQNAINMGHAELGSWLLEKWKLPNEVVVATREHHDVEFAGEHANYALLIGLTDNALGMHNIGDNRTDTLNQDYCERLGIQTSIVLEELETLMLEREQIEMLASQFAA